MLSIGLILLIMGVICVVLAAITPVPAPISQLGWIALVLGIILILLAYILPLATVHTATGLLGLR